MAIAGEKGNFMSDLGLRIITRYALIAILGTILILAFTPVIRVMKVYVDLAKVEGLFHENRYREAIDYGKRIEIWASLYPAYARRLNCIAVRCYAGFDNFDAAEELAKEIAQREPLTVRKPVNIWEIPQEPVVDLINLVLSKFDADMGLTGWSGYEALIRQLKESGRYDRMEPIVQELLEADPGNKCAMSGRGYLDQRRGMPLSSKRTTAPSTTISPVSKVNHFSLARQYVGQKEWDKAIEECDLAQAENPQDLRIKALKKTAMARNRKWAIAVNPATKAYDQAGNFLRIVEPGTTMDITCVKDTASGEIAVCKLVLPSGDTSTILIRLKDLEVRPGVYIEISEKEKTLRSRKARILGEIDKINAEIAASRSRENPHFEEYNKANTAYKQFWARKNDLDEKFKKATGEERMVYADELRRMKGQDIIVGKNYEEAKKKHDQWLADHPSTGPDDPRMESLRNELASVKDQLNSIEDEQ